MQRAVALPSLGVTSVFKLMLASTCDRSQEIRSPPYWEPKSAYPYSLNRTPEVIPASLQTIPPLQPPVAQLLPFPSHPVRPQARMPWLFAKSKLRAGSSSRSK